MLFRTYDPYFDDLKKTTQFKKEYEECFICYEFKYDNKTEPIQLQNQVYYLKSCMCVGVIHKECLDNWFSIQNKCPICRNIMVKNDCIIIPYLFYNYYLIIFFIFCKKNLSKFKKLLIAIFFISCTINYYLSLIYNKTYYYNINDDHYTFQSIEPLINHIVPLNTSIK